MDRPKPRHVSTKPYLAFATVAFATIVFSTTDCSAFVSPEARTMAPRAHDEHPADL